MAKQVKQFRYYNEEDDKNYPKELKYVNLVSGSAFSNYMPIIQLGIQSLPGTKFYLNGSNNPIIIGQTGIFELDVAGMAEIKALRFDSKSINSIGTNLNGYLIVDILYEREEE